MNTSALGLCICLLVVSQASVYAFKGKTKALCSSCSKCDSKTCPPSQSYPHLTGYDNSIIVGAFQSDHVHSKDKHIYSIPKRTKSGNTYYGWQSTTGSASGYHRYQNYMDKCTKGGSYLTVDKTENVRLRPLHSLENLEGADWKTVNAPENENHRGYKFLVSKSTNKCLTININVKARTKQTMGVANCSFDGSEQAQLIALRFLYRKAFCCCGIQNN